ncbi:ABC transporter substrate-binding protein [Actinoalloteichus hymeniacidonis]|uniref:ABC-type sugar transport system, periplasmic component n=1 Tax=Actinoalloteichus hymeniacidonis TaxID=340345 RepID=A0AAC9MZS4_9PSEU|nr:extracellular solute-binding protein [Actinoalloteichus hymeniacidonis]AOS64665.1 ABC-type sugar transport system, periplasmic component [Actinoalloteichus hymeniacidonis]MBB5907260.1 ABC-type glycerol-3-phosphate transport system substrate-binding protein [Actinoalloteichus hymeniacidonis]
MSDLGRRTLLRGMGVAGLGLLGGRLLGACATSDRSPITSGPVGVRLWTHDPGYVTTFQTAIADPALMGDSGFEFRLDITNVAPTDLITRMMAQAIADGNTPDLAGLVIDQFARVMGSSIAENLFVDLTDTVAPLGDELLKLAPYTVEGKPYSLDADNSITVLYYRQDLFAEHGVPEEVATWEELAEHGERLARDHEISLGMVSTGDNLAVSNSFFQFFLQRGGQVFDAAGELRLDSVEAVEVLEFMATGVRTGFLLGLPDPYSSACAAALKSGRLAATAMPNWYNAYGLQANVPDQQGRWRMRTLPPFAGGGHIASTLGGTGFTVLKDQAGTAAALDLLSRVFLTREGQLLRYRSGGFLPTLRSLYRDPELVEERDEYLGDQRVFDVYAPAAEDLPLFHQAPSMQILTDVLGGPVLDALRGRTSPAAAIDAGITAYRQQVKR